MWLLLTASCPFNNPFGAKCEATGFRTVPFTARDRFAHAVRREAPEEVVLPRRQRPDRSGRHLLVLRGREGHGGTS